MKKILLFILVAMVPFLTTAQKRTKKDKKITKTDYSDDKSSETTVKFMIIKGVEVDMSHQMMSVDRSDVPEKESNDVILDRLMTKYMKNMSKFYFSYDFGYGDDNMTEEVKELSQASAGFTTMAQAVNHVAQYGWEFVNSTIVVDGMITIHYYYMKR